RDDRDLLELHRGAHEVRHQGVAALVVGEDAALLVGQHLLLLQAGDDALDRVVEVALDDVRVAAAAREDRRLVADVRELRAAQAARLSRDLVEVDIGRERLAARMHDEDGLAAGEVWRRDEHLAVEPARPQQRGIEVLHAVRGAHDDDLLRPLEAVELDEELIQRLVLLAVETVPGALRADGVELVDEHDRRRVLPRLGEQLADSRRAEAGEHLDERRRARGVEVRARLVGDRLREQRLAGPRRAVQEQALRYLRAEPLEALRLTQEVDHLHQLRADLLDARDVAPRHARAGAAREMRRADARHHPDRL